jgi:uroporphyrinogen III methyltransferase / synthase
MTVDKARTHAGSLPLHGRCIVVTRAEEGGSALTELLRERGARVLELPLIRVLPPLDPAPLEAAAARLSSYDWVVFTSATAVRAFRAVLLRAGSPEARPRWAAAVGSATARAVAGELGWSVDAVPDEFSGAHLTSAISAVASVAGRSVLWPRAAGALAAVRHDLEAAGARLDAPEAYRTEPLPDAAAELAHRIAARDVDAVTFTSPSAVRCYAATAAAVGDVCVAVIGPSTAAAARAAGIRVHIQPQEHTFRGLAEELIRQLAGARAEAAAKGKDTKHE